MTNKINKIANHQTLNKMKKQFVPDPPDTNPGPVDKPPRINKRKEKKSDKSIKQPARKRQKG